MGLNEFLEMEMFAKSMGLPSPFGEPRSRQKKERPVKKVAVKVKCNCCPNTFKSKNPEIARCRKCGASVKEV